MVGMQVTLALAEPPSQLRQHLFDGGRAEVELPEVPHQVRLPSAVNASPFIANEAKNPKAPMLGVVTAGCRSTTLFVLLFRHTLLVGQAVPGFAKCSASGLATRAKWKVMQRTHRFSWILRESLLERRNLFIGWIERLAVRHLQADALDLFVHSVGFAVRCLR